MKRKVENGGMDHSLPYLFFTLPNRKLWYSWNRLNSSRICQPSSPFIHKPTSSTKSIRRNIKLKYHREKKVPTKVYHKLNNANPHGWATYATWNFSHVGWTCYIPICSHPVSMKWWDNWVSPSPTEGLLLLLTLHITTLCLSQFRTWF